MTIIVRRVLSAHVSVNNKIVSSINRGLLLYVGIAKGDTSNDIDYYAKKIAHLRIFEGENTEVSVQEINGEILSISQFTLSAKTNKGNRPSYIEAMSSQEALLIFDKFNQILEQYAHRQVLTGVFGADMLISSVDDGPFTIIL